MFSSSVSFLPTSAAEQFRKKVHIYMYKMQRESKNLPGQQSCSCSSNTRSPHGSMCRTDATWWQGPPHCPFHFSIIFYLEHLKVGVNDQREYWVVLAVKVTKQVHSLHSQDTNNHIKQSYPYGVNVWESGYIKESNMFCKIMKQKRFE
jgi:hypothetical protein